MNLREINEWRAAHGLTPVVVDEKAKREQKIRRDRNHAERAAANRALRNSRSTMGKGK